MTSGASTAWVPRENGSHRVRPTRGTPRPTSPNQECTHDRRPVRRRPTAAARSSGPSSPSTTRPGWRSWPAALHAAGVAIVSTGSTAKTIAAARHPVTQVEELTGFPECLDGRVKTLHPQVHAGILADTRKPDHVRQLADLGVEPFDLVVVNLYPFRETVASGASAGRVHRADRHRRPVDGARRREEPRERRDRDDPAAYAHVLEAVGGRGLHAGRAPAARRRGVRAHRRLRQRRRELDGQRLRRHDATAPASRPGRARPSTARRCCATARTRTSRRRSTATGARASRRPSSCTARRCPTTTTSTPTPPCAPRTTTATSRPSRSSSTPTPAASPSASTIEEAYDAAHATDPVSRLRRHHRREPPVTAAMAAAAKPVFTEVIVAPDFEPEALEILTAKKNLRILRLPAGMAEAADPIETRADQRRAARADGRQGRRRRAGEGGESRVATTPRTGGSSPASRPTRRRSPTCSSPGARSAP